MNFASKITLLRISLTPFFLICLIYKTYDPAFWFFLASILTDALDGFVARKYRQITKFGAFLDQVADKIVLIPSYTLLLYLGLIPKWFFILLLSRDFAILVGWIIYLAREQSVKTLSRFSGKLAISAQMVYFLLLIFSHAYPALGGRMATVLEVMSYGVALLTFVSFVDYLTFGSKKLNDR